MQRAVILAPGDRVEIDSLHLAAAAPLAPRAAPRPEMVTPTTTVAASPAASRKVNKMSEVEREHILATLASVDGSRTLAGQRLGMSERTLRHKLRQYRLDGFLKA